MPVLYRTIQSTMQNKEGDKLFHPRAVYVGSVNTDTIAREIADYSSLSTGDVKNTIDNLVTVMTRHLQASEVVTLDGLGNFRLTMKSTGKGAKTKDEVSASQAKVKVIFTPTATRNTNRTIATRSLVTGVKCVLFKGDAEMLNVDNGNDNTGGSGTGAGGNNEGDSGDGSF